MVGLSVDRDLVLLPRNVAGPSAKGRCGAPSWPMPTASIAVCQDGYALAHVLPIYRM